MNLKYTNIAISGKIAVGTTTLAKNLEHVLGWRYINAGLIQREYDQKHHINENKQGAASRPDRHEQEIEAMTKKMLSSEKNLIYEAWLSGFIAKDLKGVLKVLLICSHEDIRIDRVVNRENISIEEAKQQIKQREEENFIKWKKLYGNYNFWHPKYFNLIVDTYSAGPMETLGKVLDKLGYKHR